MNGRNPHLPSPECIVKVGGGRGFIIEHRVEIPKLLRLKLKALRQRKFTKRRLIVTAAHCLPNLPPPGGSPGAMRGIVNIDPDSSLRVHLQSTTRFFPLALCFCGPQRVQNGSRMASLGFGTHASSGLENRNIDHCISPHQLQMPRSAPRRLSSGDRELAGLASEP